MTILDLLILGFIFIFSLKFSASAIIYAPLLLGLPHIAADFIYFFFNKKFPKRLATILLLSAVSLIFMSFLLNTKAFLVVGLMTPILSLVLIKTENSKNKYAVILGLILIFLIFLLYPHSFQKSLILGHNLVALIAWFVIRENDLNKIRITAFITTIGSLLILFYSDESWLTLNCFLQLIHYLIWIKFIPRSKVFLFYTATYLVLVGIFLFFSTSSISHANWKDYYLNIFQFHVFLEITVLAHVILEKERHPKISYALV
jgi:hypothetical protein